MVNRLKLNWPMLAKIYVLATLAVAITLTVSMFLMPGNTVQYVLLPSELLTHEPYIPNSPSKNPIGKPADIPGQYLIEEEDFCLRRDNLQVVSYVHSAISRVEQRRNTRRTWANSSAPGLNMTVVFMVGRAKNQKEEAIVRNESSLYHDIVQGNYTDHYRLLSYKALSSLYWVTRHCSHVPWTLHADDDLLIDTFLLQKLIHNLDDGSKEKFMCHQLRGSVLRKGKWVVTKEEYRHKLYPYYCQGTVWLLATHQVPKLLQASKEVDFLWVDDAYITGVLAKKAKIKRKSVITRSAQKKLDKTAIGETFAWYHPKETSRWKYWRDIINHYQPTTNASVAP